MKDTNEGRHWLNDRNGLQSQLNTEMQKPDKKNRSA